MPGYDGSEVQYLELQVVDLSADFRLRSVDEYAKWYGGEHQAPDLQKEAVYGLTEIYRDQVRSQSLSNLICSRFPLWHAATLIC